MAKAKTRDTTGDVVVQPALPGYLTLPQIAKLAGVSAVTMRGYYSAGSSNIPRPASRAGATPLWAVDDVVQWLAARPFAPTTVTQRADGSLTVERRGAGD